MIDATKTVSVRCDCDPAFPCRLNVLAIRLCENCQGTGQIEDLLWDNEAKRYIWSGVRACICTIEQ